jgi:cyanophycin synthetase
MVFLAEEYIEGNDYRILILNNKVIAVTHRAFPEIIGNGQDTVKNLIKKYYQARQYFKKKNKKPLFDHELMRNLKAQKVGLNEILPKDKKIRLRQTANIFGGGMAINMTNKIHPFYKKIALKAAKELELNLTGIDLMTQDISKKGNYAIIEMNSFPSLDMHENPDVGKAVPVSKLIFKSIFPKLK